MTLLASFSFAFVLLSLSGKDTAISMAGLLSLLPCQRLSLKTGQVYSPVGEDPPDTSHHLLGYNIGMLKAYQLARLDVPRMVAE